PDSSKLSLVDGVRLFNPVRKFLHRLRPQWGCRKASGGHPRTPQREVFWEGSSSIRRGGSGAGLDRKSTRLNSSHGSISYAVFFPYYSLSTLSPYTTLFRSLLTLANCLWSTVFDYLTPYVSFCTACGRNGDAGKRAGDIPAPLNGRFFGKGHRQSVGAGVGLG